MNNVCLIGRLGADPEIRYFESGTAKTRLRLAVDHPSKDKKTDWIDVEMWGKTAESAAEHLKKGSQVGVVGAIEVNEYEKDGQKRKAVYVNAQRWEFAGSKPRDGGESGGGSRGGGYDDEIPY